MPELALKRRLVATLAIATLAIVLALPLANGALAAAGALMAALALLGAHTSARQLHAEVETVEVEPIEGTSFALHFRLANQGRRTALGPWRMRLPGPCDVEGQSAGYECLPPGKERRHELVVTPRLFGAQRFGPLEFRLEDPFGFAACDLEAAPPIDIGVRPTRARLRDSPLHTRQQRALMGAYEVSQPGSGFEFFGLRNYAVGDRPRDVNWKASARTGRLIVNQREKESDAEIVLLVDLSQQAIAGRLTVAPYAQSCRAALAVADAHLRARDAVRFIMYGPTHHEDRHTGSVRHLRGIEEQLMGARPAGDANLAEAIHRLLPSFKPRSPVMLFTCAVGDPTMRAAVMLLRSHDHPVSAFVPAADWAGLEGSDVDAWDREQSESIRLLRGLGVPVALHAPDSRIESSLGRIEVLA